MKPGIYSVSYTPFSDTTRTQVDTVLVDDQGAHYLESPINGMFNRTQPYGTEAEGYSWAFREDMSLEKYEGYNRVC